MGQNASRPNSPNLKARALPAESKPAAKKASTPRKSRSYNGRSSRRMSSFCSDSDDKGFLPQTRPPLIRADTALLPAASPEWGHCSDSNEEFGGLKILVAGRSLNSLKKTTELSITHPPSAGPEALDLRIGAIDSTYLAPPLPYLSHDERGSPKSHWSESSAGEQTPPMPFQVFRNSMAFSLNSKRFSSMSADPRQSAISTDSGSSGQSASRPPSAAIIPALTTERTEKENSRIRRVSLKKAKKRGGIVVVSAERMGSQRYSMLQHNDAAVKPCQSSSDLELTPPDVSAAAQALRRAELRGSSKRDAETPEQPITFIATSPDLEADNGNPPQDFDYMPLPRPLVARLPVGHPAAHHDRFKANKDIAVSFNESLHRSDVEQQASASSYPSMSSSQAEQVSPANDEALTNLHPDEKDMSSSEDAVFQLMPPCPPSIEERTRLESPLLDLYYSTPLPVTARTPPSFAGFSFDRPLNTQLHQSGVSTSSEPNELALAGVTDAATSLTGPVAKRALAEINLPLPRALPRHSTVDFPTSPPLVPYENQSRRGTFPRGVHEVQGLAIDSRLTRNQAFESLLDRARSAGSSGSRVGSTRKRGYERADIHAWLVSTRDLADCSNIE